MMLKTKQTKKQAHLEGKKRAGFTQRKRSTSNKDAVKGEKQKKTKRKKLENVIQRRKRKENTNFEPKI